MTVDVAVQWIAYATRMSLDKVLGLGLSSDQAITLGRRLSENRLLNPPRQIPVKVDEFICHYCGKRFTREWKTARPKYCSRSHRQMAYEKRRKAKQQ